MCSTIPTNVIVETDCVASVTIPMLRGKSLFMMVCHWLSSNYHFIFCRAQKKFICSSCNEENIVTNCFRDKAVEYELRNTTLKCLNQSCPWEGESRFYQVSTVHNDVQHGLLCLSWAHAWLIDNRMCGESVIHVPGSNSNSNSNFRGMQSIAGKFYLKFLLKGVTEAGP